MLLQSAEILMQKEGNTKQYLLLFHLCFDSFNVKIIAVRRPLLLNKELFTVEGTTLDPIKSMAITNIP